MLTNVSVKCYCVIVDWHIYNSFNK